VQKVGFSTQAVIRSIENAHALETHFQQSQVKRGESSFAKEPAIKLEQ
jgi:hypothetical protein